jgi:hypothetical protein
MVRAIVSGEPPGGNGTMILTGRSGKLWDAAIVEKSATNPASNHLIMTILPSRFRGAQFTYSEVRNTMVFHRPKQRGFEARVPHSRRPHGLVLSTFRAVRAATIAFLLLNGALMNAALAETVGFDSDRPGTLPAGWEQGVTGRGTPRWAVVEDASAPSKPHVLKQSGSGAFPWCVLRGASIADGFIEVKFKALSGKEDQAGGILWRWKNGDNYYVARANALENNVSLYYTEGARRTTLKYVDAPVPPNAWHVLRVEFTGQRISVALNGKIYIEMDDGHIRGAGAVGVWTKADSVTLFDDFVFGARK